MDIVKYETAVSFPAAADEYHQRPYGLSDLVSMLWRRAPVILGVAAVAAIATLVIILMQTPTYTATATILIDPQRQRVVQEDQALSDQAPSSAMVDSEIEILKSRQLAESLAAELDLVSSADWNPALRTPGVFAQLKQGVRQLLGRAPARSANDAESQMDTVSENVADAITVRRRALSYVIDVKVDAPDADQAALMANTIVQLYLQGSTRARAETGEAASNWLLQRLEVLRQDVETKEAAAANYRLRNGLLTTDGVSLTEQQMVDVQGSVLAARADLAEKEARRQQLQEMLASNGSADTLAGVLTSETIRDMRQREADLVRQQAERETTLGDRHPSVINGRAELSEIRAEIRAETGRIAANLGNEVAVARARLRNLEGSLGSVRGQLVSDTASQVQMRELERDANAARSVYEEFLQRYHEIAGQGRLGSADARIISSANTPSSPSSPRLNMAFLMALAIGGALGLVAGFLAEATDGVLRNADQTARATGALVIASIPVIPKRAMRLLDASDRHPAGYLVEEPMSAFAEAFRMMRTSITYFTTGKRVRVVAVTSPSPSEGKTTTALCLARIAAMGGQRTLLIDCDLRTRSLNDVLDIEPAAGLQHVLNGERTWRSIVGSDELSGAHVLPLADADFVSGDILGRTGMRDLLNEVRPHYDMIVLDCAPVLVAAEAPVSAALADATILVTRCGKTTIRNVKDALELLRLANAQVLGVALNFVDPKTIRRPYAVTPMYQQDAPREYETA